jgi:hypothetical protein
MFKQLPIISAIVALFLTGCASTAPLQPTRIAWDGLGRDPNRPIIGKRSHSPSPGQRNAANSEREKVLVTLRPYSDAWWVVHDEIEAENDRDLRTKLVICEGCTPHGALQDVTGSTSKHQN